MVSMDAFASAFGFDAKSDDVWTTLGKVTAVNSGTLSVLLGGSATPTECEAYCLASVGDIVFVAITKGRARAIACKGVDAATWRNALGLGSMATEDSGDYVSKSETIPINRGGTGATSVADARTNLGCNPVAYTPTWSQYGTPPHWHCSVSNGICHFMYQGPASATPTNTLLCTFPAACRPSVQTWIPFVKGGGAYGIAYIDETNGKLIVNQISSTTNTARLIIDASWPVA